MREKNLEKQIKEQEETLKQLKLTLKEKEQLNRVSTYKLNELKRNAKSNEVDKLNIKQLKEQQSESQPMSQLKPRKTESNASEGQFYE